MADLFARADALPFVGDGPIPPERDRTLDQDTASFRVVMTLLLRAWPYIRPQLFGRWYHPKTGIESGMADEIASSGYSFAYAPALTTLAALAGPWLDWVPATTQYPMILLYVSVAAMVTTCWLVAFSRGGFQLGAAVAAMLAALAANLLATFVIDGFADGGYVILVTLCCVLGWLVQFRAANGGVEVRIRLHAHLVYYYAVVWAQRMVALAMGVIIADLLNQSILQNQPILPALAALAGHEEWARGVAQTLTVEERHAVTWLYVAITFTLWAAQVPLHIVQPIYRVWILQRINQDLRIALVERWHQLSLRYHSEHRVGDSIFRIYQDSAQVTAVIDRLMGIVVMLISYFTAMLLVSLLSPWLGLVGTLVIIPALLWGRWAMPRMRTRALVNRAATSDLTSRIQESFGAIREIKAYQAEERVQQLFEEDSIIAFNAAYRVRSLIALVSIVMFGITGVFLLGGEFMMALWANARSATWARDLMALTGLTFVVWNLAAFNWTKAEFEGSGWAARSLMRQWLSSQDIAMGLQRVFDILDIEPDVTNAPGAVPFETLAREIRFDNVSFAYEPSRPVLRDVTFSARPGTITAIVGPTGSGKSTVVGLLLRLYDPVGGTITIDGVDLRAYDVDTLRREIAIALQENVLFALSVRDNIRYVAPEADDAAVHEAIRIACMQDYISSLPAGLDTVLGDRGGRLSTGQRQRLSIARAVVRDTPILILDEPTAALDAATEHAVMDNLSDWGRKRVIFLITHRISTIRRADNILYLDEGRIIESGDHDELMAFAGGRYRAFVEAESHLSRRNGDG